MKNKTFIVEIEFNTIDLRVTTKNKTEARKKALKKLSRKNPKNLIKRNWPSNRKCIWVDEI